MNLDIFRELNRHEYIRRDHIQFYPWVLLKSKYYE